MPSYYRTQSTLTFGTVKELSVRACVACLKLLLHAKHLFSLKNQLRYHKPQERTLISVHELVGNLNDNNKQIKPE